jgi:hypothetical protein
MKAVLLATAMFALPAAAMASQITAFGQTSSSNTLTAATNAMNTITTFTEKNALIDLTQLLGLGPMNNVFFNLSAASIDAAVTVGPAIIQHYSGNFCISTAADCGGTDILSGVFTDAAFGASGGTGLTVQVSDPPDTLTLLSDLIPATKLDTPDSLNFALSALSPKLHIVGDTIAGFTASIAGNVSAVAAVPEPAALAMLGVGLIGLTAVRRTRNQ